MSYTRKPKPISIKLNAPLLEVLEKQFWYAPAASTLVYNGRRLPALSRSYASDPNADPRRLWFFGTKRGDAVNPSQDPIGIQIGGAGDDTLGTYAPVPAKGRLGAFLMGGAGRDTFLITIDPATLNASATIFNLTTKDTVRVSAGYEIEIDSKTFARVVAEAERLYGTAHLEFAVYANGKRFNGSTYDDTITITGKNATILAGDGNDVVYGNAGQREKIEGGNGDDLIEGFGGGDTLSGGAGADTISVYAGDVVIGADDQDTYIVSGFGVSTATLRGTILYRLTADKKHKAIAGGTGNDSLAGYAQGATLTGGGGKDIFWVDDADDVITDAEKGDTIIIESADQRLIDKALKNWSAANIVFDISFGDATAPVGFDAWTGNDTINGSRFEDRIDGKDGNDRLSGDAGDDDLFGGNDQDTLDGGDGNDLLFGDDGHDLIFGGAGDDGAEGGNGDDTLFGGAGNDALYGEDGNDLIDGGAGADLLSGGAGADTLYGGSGSDDLYGGEDNDVLMGGDGRDTLYGDEGDDILVGGTEDELWGGEGRDRFVFVPGTNGTITINDFEAGKDVIDLSAFTLMKGYDEGLFKSGIAFDARHLTLSIDVNRDGTNDLTIRFAMDSQFDFNTPFRDIAFNPL